MSIAEFYWPGQRDLWGLAGWWTPDEASATQPPSGLAALVAPSGDTSRLTWEAGELTWDHAGVELGTDGVLFGAGDSIGWAIGYDGSRATLVVRLDGGTVLDDSTVTGPGTTERNWLSLLVGEATAGFGGEDFGDGTFGGDDPTEGPHGVVEMMIGERPLTVAEATDVLGASSAFGGLPYEAWPIWHASGDSTAMPVGSEMIDGLRWEAAAEGDDSTRVYAYGLTKGLGVLDVLVTPRTPFAVRLAGTELAVGAFLATTGDEDDLADHHAQFAAANDQELRFR